MRIHPSHLGFLRSPRANVALQVFECVEMVFICMLSPALQSVASDVTLAPLT